MNKRIGFACKWIDSPDQVDGIKPKDDCKKYNTGSTTVAWLNRQSKDVAEQKLWDLVKGNIESTRLLVERVSKLNENLRMVRLSSDILPVYTEPTWSYFYRDNTVRQYCERHFSTIGNLARSSGIRLSFHPGQFTVLASDNEQIVERSIEEFEYHVDMARWMGYGKEFQDYKINVHIADKRLSPEARSCITIENEEISYGLDDCLGISDIVPIVLDIHHHWVREGVYIQHNDDRIKRIIDSWRGRRPVAHYSISREDILVNHCVHTLPDHKVLLESGHKKQRLRAHSDFYWNTAVNEWALGFLESHDIMAESKAKNLASFALHKEAEQLGLS
ncbi:UV damage endonuclease UvsE [bacterium]|nr:UV damage endonuclease UvsE [bacterium]